MTSRAVLERAVEVAEGAWWGLNMFRSLIRSSHPRYLIPEVRTQFTWEPYPTIGEAVDLDGGVYRIRDAQENDTEGIVRNVEGWGVIQTVYTDAAVRISSDSIYVNELGRGTYTQVYDSRVHIVSRGSTVELLADCHTDIIVGKVDQVWDGVVNYLHTDGQIRAGDGVLIQTLLGKVGTLTESVVVGLEYPGQVGVAERCTIVGRRGSRVGTVGQGGGLYRLPEHPLVNVQTRLPWDVDHDLYRGRGKGIMPPYPTPVEQLLMEGEN